MRKMQPPPVLVPIQMKRDASISSYLEQQKEALRILFVNVEYLLKTSVKSYTETGVNYTFSATDYVVNATTSGVTVTLRDEPEGNIRVLKNSSGGNVTLAGTIDGVVNKTVATMDSVTVMSDGTNWIEI